MMIKQTIFSSAALAGILLAAHSPARADDSKRFGSPVVIINRVEYQVVVHDKTTGQFFDDARNGFCRRMGYTMQTNPAMEYADGVGPYAILDGSGKIVQTFPATGNEGRFEVAVDLYCLKRHY